MTPDLTDKPLSIAIVGTGGVGGYFGGRLAFAGHNVTFVARGEHLSALKEHGLKVLSIEGNFSVNNITATDDLASIGPQDIVIFATKAWQLKDAAKNLKNAVTSNTLLLPLLNGVDAPSQLESIYGAERVLGGLCKIISFIDAPGVIKHTGALPYIAFGELSGHLSERCKNLSAVLEDAGIKHKLSPNILVDMWEKFLFISAMSALGAITAAPIGPIRMNETTRKALRDVMSEIQAVATSLNIRIKEDIVDKTLQFMDKLPPMSTTSMQRDIAAGKVSEIEAQLGTVVQLAKEKSISTPMSDFIYAALSINNNE